MNYYCDVCDKTIKIKSKNKHLQSLTQNKIEECIRIKQTIRSPDFFDVYEILNKYITNNNKELDLYLDIYDFSLVFDTDFYPHSNSENQ